MNQPAYQPAHRSLAAIIGHLVKQIIVFCFVIWHLVFLIITNTKSDDALSDQLKEWPAAESFITAVVTYESHLGIDQAWKMFSSPVWKKTPFLAVRIEFDDGGSELMLSDNEPRDVQRYFKTTMARLRKLEDHLLELSENDYRYAMCKRYAQWRVDRWLEANPQEHRRPVRVVLLKRVYQVPGPDADPNANREPKTEELHTIVLSDIE